MEMKPLGTKVEANDSVHPLFVSSTMAMFPVGIGFFVYSFLTHGDTGFAGLVVSVAILFNLILFYLWQRLEHPDVKFRFMSVITAVQWGYVLNVFVGVVVPLNSGWPYTNILGSIIVSSVLLYSMKKWVAMATKGPLLFSVFGVLAMGALVWSGLGHWTMSAHAHSLKTKGKYEIEDQKNGSASGSNFKKSQRELVMWKYSGETGPEMWGALDESYKLCSSGRYQSPVDIPKRTPSLKNDLKMDWKNEEGFLVNTGRTIQVNLSGNSKSLMAGSSFSLKQVHFHTTSEHQIGGLNYPMEVHFDHEDSEGKQAVIAAIVEIGQVHPEYEKILPLIGASAGKTGVQTSSIDLRQLLPENTAVFRYIGSSTTPPCHEEVVWSIFSQPLEFSAEQVAAFRKLYPNNARPVQSFGERTFETSSSH